MPSPATPSDRPGTSPEGAVGTRSPSPVVGVIFGSASDWPTMRLAVEMLERFGVPSEHQVVSAHRTPDHMRDYARGAAARGLQMLIAGAGGAAHLPGMVAAWTSLPVFGVPVESRALKGLDSLLSMAQMPGGVPVGTLAIGESGAKNAALLAVRVLAIHDEGLRAKLAEFHATEARNALEAPLT